MHERSRQTSNTHLWIATAVVATLLVVWAAAAPRALAHTAGWQAQGQPAGYGDEWQPLTAIAGGPRQEHGVGALGDDLYVIGGIVPTGSGNVTTGRVEVYDTRNRRWTPAAPLPVAMNHPNVAVARGQLYVLGGLSGGASWNALGDAFVYRPREDRWQRLPDVPAGEARGSAAVGVHGDRILLAGGMRTLVPGPGGLHDTVDTVSSYDVRTGRWQTLPALPEGRDHAGGAVVDGTLFVVGGRIRGQVNVRDTVFALDPRRGRWAERARMPTPRGGIATATVGDRIYTFGGEGNPADDTRGVYAETEVYDVKRNGWTSLAPMPMPRHGTAAVAVGRTIYIPGGGDAMGGAPVDTHDLFRPRGR